MKTFLIVVLISGKLFSCKINADDEDEACEIFEEDFPEFTDCEYICEQIGVL